MLKTLSIQLCCVFLLVEKAFSAPLSEIGEETGAAWEQGEHFEGDMLLTPEQRAAVQGAEEPDFLVRNGLVNVTQRWPNNTVVYHIQKQDFNDDQIAMIVEAMRDIASHSCVRFKPRQHDEHAVVIQGTSCGCFSEVGFNSTKENGQQVLNLSERCFRHGTIVHEMLHTLGFYHMQSAHDRDEYVKIHWQNIDKDHKHNFLKYNDTTVTHFGVTYDYGSVMHYPTDAFSVNGEPTIEPLQANVTIGQREGLSEKDIVKLNKMYCEKYALE